MSPVEAAAAHPNLLAFQGLEVYEGELETGMEPEPMRMMDVAGWQISPNNRKAAPDGQTLLRRAAQIKKTLTAEGHRSFHGNEQEQRAGTLKGLYVEISYSTEHYFKDPVCREALIADILALAKMGESFTVSTG